MIRSFKGEYDFLSNYYEAPVEYEGMVYRNNEAAFQAQKCSERKKRTTFSSLTPSEAKIAGRTLPLRRDWESVKAGIMRDLVRNKFEQNSDLKERLLETGEEYLEEGNDWGDRVWGTVKGDGANLLGKILMEVREEIRTQKGGSR